MVPFKKNVLWVYWGTLGICDPLVCATLSRCVVSISAHFVPTLLYGFDQVTSYASMN